MENEKNINYIKTSKEDVLIAIGSLMILGLFAWMVYYDFSPLIEVESDINYLFTQLFGNPTMTYSDGIGNSILTFLANYGGAKTLSLFTLVISAFLFIKREWFLSIWFVGVVSIGGIVGILLKNIFQRTRPVNHLPLDDGFSFPSGHAIVSTLFFLTIIMVFLPRIKNNFIKLPLSILSIVSWLGILFSRLYFHAHHLADIIAGVFYGIFWIIMAIFIYNFIIDRLHKINRENN